MREKFIIFLIALAVIIFFIVDYKFDSSNKKKEDLIQAIEKRGHIVVGVKTDTKPFGYIDNNGNNVGFDIDLAKRIAKEIFQDDSKIEFVQVTPSNRLYVLNSGQVDMIVATMTITPERQNLVNFSKSYFLTGQAVLVNNSSNCKSLSDLNGKNVGVLYGSTAEKNIRVLIASARVLGYKTYNDAYCALKSGKIVAITSDDTILRNYALTDPTVKLLPKRYTKEYYSIAVRKSKESNSLLKIVNSTISKMIEDGSLYSLRKKWNLN